MPEPMPKISLNVPAYTNDDFSTSFPASNANNATYHDTNYWRTAAAPTGNANSGTLTQSPGFTTPFPVYLAYDLSGVALYQRRQVVLAWYNDAPGTGAYDPALIANPYDNLARDYTIDVNAAAGGSLPVSGWVTKVTITNNTYHSRQHTFDMSGYNWVRINVTAAIGSAGNNNVAMNMDIHDAHLGVQDSWIFYGDSITQRGLNHDDTSSGTLPAQINVAKSLFFPIWENAGVGGFTAADYQPLISGYLAFFPGKYVAIPLGTNDATGGGALLTSFQANMQSMVNAVIAAGKIPIVPHIPWNSIATANAVTLNGYIDTIIAGTPGAIAGPDLYAYFNANQSFISGDGVHPTDPAGYNAYRTQWVNWATANIYNLKQINTDGQSTYKTRTVLTSRTQTSHKVRAVLKTTTRTSFKIQISPSNPKPLLVSQVATSPFARPVSTVTSTATVIDDSNNLQTNLTATCTITYPDNSTLTGQVYNIGAGLYEVIYTTKAAGTVTELWIFTDSLGSKVEYQHTYPCYFENS